MSEVTESVAGARRTEQEQDVVLEVRDATVSYEMTRGQARVLNDVDIDVYRGETLGIVGESGCGKSMFASALLDAVTDPGLLQGEITYYPADGTPVDILDLSPDDLRRLRWEEIAMVFQGAMSSFNPTRTIRTHFEETLEAHNADEAAGMERARDIMRKLNLDPEQVLPTYQHELSGGQRQRVLIALSLILEPEVLVLDEPTAALDLLMQRSILRLLAEIREEYNITFVIISHDLPVVSGFANRIGVMYAFEFVEIGDPEEVILDGAHPYTRALIRSTPNLSMSTEEITTVEGSSPDPVNIPAGCPYHPRCPIAEDRCEIEKPGLLYLDEEESQHRVACFFPDRARSEIPIDLRGDGQ